MTPNTPPETTAAESTDRIIWIEPTGDFRPQNIIFVTEGGGLGINVGGYVFVKPIKGWHELAALKAQRPASNIPETMCANCDALLRKGNAICYECHRAAFRAPQQPSGAQAGLVDASRELFRLKAMKYAGQTYTPAEEEVALCRAKVARAEYDARPLPGEPENEGWPTGRAESELRRITTASPLPASEPLDDDDTCHSCGRPDEDCKCNFEFAEPPPQQPVRVTDEIVARALAAHLTAVAGFKHVLPWEQVEVDSHNGNAIRKAIEAIAPMLGQGKDAWQAIESAPDDHFPVLVWNLKYGRGVAFRDVTWEWYSLPMARPLLKPTHWMPLPPQPQSPEAAK